MLFIKHKISNPTPIGLYIICDKREAEVQTKRLTDGQTDRQKNRQSFVSFVNKKHVTCDKWHGTHDMWHVTYDR